MLLMDTRKIFSLYIFFRCNFAAAQILVNLFVLITDSTANSFPACCRVLFQFFVFIFRSWKIRGESNSSEDFTGVIICEEKSGIARDAGRPERSWETFWHGATSPFTPWCGVAEKGNGRKAFSRNTPTTWESAKACYRDALERELA